MRSVPVSESYWSTLTMEGMPAAQFYGLSATATPATVAGHLADIAQWPADDSLENRNFFACTRSGLVSMYCMGDGPQACGGLACGSFEGVGQAAELACEIWCGPALIKGGLKGIAALRAISVGGESLWSLSPFLRGQQIEAKLLSDSSLGLGRGLPSNFPVIDAVDDATGLVTSIKSLDVTAQSYQSMSTLSRVLQKYVDLVAQFSGRTWAGERIAGSAIKSRALLVAIDKNAMSAEQWNQMTGAIAYGADRGVAVKFVNVQ